MEHRADTIIKVVAIGQFIPFFIYPPDAYMSVSPFILAVGLIFFVFLGYEVWCRRPWARTLTIFLQGFNIIARIMMFLSTGAYPLKQGGGANWPFIVTALIGMALSAFILLRFDVPEVELAFNA